MTTQNVSDFPGARWWKFDFHTHTPASIDYGMGPDSAQLKKITPEDWLLSYMRAGIDCVAVTDHNSGEWVDKLKEALGVLKSHPEYRPLFLFPGVELSVNGGVHFLAIFDVEKTTADITRLLGAVGYRGTSGHSDEVTSKSASEVIQEIDKSGGLIIPAHADQEKGIFKVLNGPSLAQILDCHAIIAVELFDGSFHFPPLYKDRNLSWTSVLGTDGHHPGAYQVASGTTVSPGSHYTWVKMGQPTLEGLRLSLFDGAPLSMRRSDTDTGNPNRHAENLIRSIEIGNARYCGRGEPMTAQFNPWLNTIIGGRGTGKSTIVEFLRIAARRVEELPGKMLEYFNDFQRVPGSRDDQGALTEETRVQVVYQTVTGKYRLQWDTKGTLTPIEEMQMDGTWKQAPGDIRQRFPVRIFSQKQIFALAEESQGLLKVIDDASEVDRRSWEIRWGQEEARFLSFRGKIRELWLQLAEFERVRGELDDVNRKLKLFEGAEHSRVLAEYQKRQRQHRSLQEFGKGIGAIEQQLMETAEAVLPMELDQSLFEADDPADRDILERTSKIAAAIQVLQSELEKLTKKAREASESWETSFKDSAWHNAFIESTKAYEDLVKSLKGQGAGDPSQYGSLVQKRQVLESKLQTLKETAELLKEVKRQALESLDRLCAIRGELSDRRANFLRTILRDNPYVRIELAPYSQNSYGQNLRDVEVQFRRLIGREDWFEDDILSTDESKGLIADLYRDLPKDKKSATEEIERRLKATKKTIMDMFLGQSVSGFGKRFQTFINKLPPEAADRIETWFPEDSLWVSYSIAADGSKFRPIQQASPGQKTAAILAFLLAYGDEPMIIDQPEDDLDNYLIYDLIVRQLRENKKRRQLIVVTHNPNIVVNGDAELVLGMDHREGQCCLTRQGSLQELEIREEVCRVMEGGREAFTQRYRRILQGVSHV